jgi:hypothetical protein
VGKGCETGTVDASGDGRKAAPHPTLYEALLQGGGGGEVCCSGGTGHRDEPVAADNQRTVHQEFHATHDGGQGPNVGACAQQKNLPYLMVVSKYDRKNILAILNCES